MEAIDTKAIKDAVAKKHGEYDWNMLLHDFKVGNFSNEEFEKLENEVISEVAKQVAEAQKMICANKARTGPYSRPGLMDFSMTVVNKESILNAPSPEIK